VGAQPHLRQPRRLARRPHGHDHRVIRRHQPGTGQNHLDPQGNPYEFAYRGVAVQIRSVLITSEQIIEAVQTDSMVVWSPSNHLVL